MSGETSTLKRFILNSSLVLLGILVLILFYALAMNHFREADPNTTAVVSDEAPSAVREIYDVEILNGCGEHGLAAKMREYLIAHHLDVVGTGNHTNFKVEKTRIIDRRGKEEAARRVASILGIEPSQIVRDLDARLQVDVSVIIGKDYRSVEPFTN